MNSVMQADMHGEPPAFSGCYLDYPWLVPDVADVTDRIGEPLPGLDADETGAGLGPNAQSGEVGKIYLKLWTDLCPVGHASADKPIENKRIRNEKLISQEERVTHDRRLLRLG